MMLTDEHKSILKNHYTAIDTRLHESAVEIFNTKDISKFKDIIFIKSHQIETDLGSEITIEGIINALDEVKNNLKDNLIYGGHSIESWGDEYESNMTLYVTVWTLQDSSNIQSSVNCTLGCVVRDFEFKYVHQRYGKDTLRHLAKFEKLGIKFD